MQLSSNLTRFHGFHGPIFLSSREWKCPKSSSPWFCFNFVVGLFPIEDHPHDVLDAEEGRRAGGLCGKYNGCRIFIISCIENIYQQNYYFILHGKYAVSWILNIYLAWKMNWLQNYSYNIWFNHLCIDYILVEM